MASPLINARRSGFRRLKNIIFRGDFGQPPGTAQTIVIGHIPKKPERGAVSLKNFHHDIGNKIGQAIEFVDFQQVEALAVGGREWKSSRHFRR